MSEKFNQNKYDVEYKKANYYKPSILFPKSAEPLIRSAATEAGQSVSEFIKVAVMEKLKKA